jgi:penicillin-binding protein 1C
MLKQFGVQRFYDSLQRAGLSTLTRVPDDYGLTLVLGGAEGTLWDLANQYANLAFVARQAEAVQPIRYRHTHLLRDDQPRFGNVTDYGPASAWLTLSALQEVTRPAEESHWKQFANAEKIAWKTGTSWGFRDAWAIGDTSRYTVAVWVGNATGEGRAGLTGSVAAAPIMFDIFGHLEASPWFARPTHQMKEVLVCKNDGYLANGACDTETQYVPRTSHFDRLSPNNVLVHLDEEGHRVASECQSVTQMRHTQWFALPPAQEFYYRRLHADYQALPALRSDCAADARSKKGPMDFIYPTAGTRIYIPIDLGNQKSRTIFEAVHRDSEATLYWHLDDQYLGVTHTFHQQALDVRPGTHVITIVDSAGNRLSRSFEVLGE